VPDWRLVTHAEKGDPDRLAAELGLPLIVKPAAQGSSLGMSLARTIDELAAGIPAALALDSEVMVEQYIKGREITGGVLGNSELTALPLVEIIPGDSYSFFDYQAKYQPGASREICPADFSAAITAKAQACALAAHRALHLRGYSRTDMIVRNEEIFLLETNTIPGMTPTSLLPQAAKAHGLSFAELLDRLLWLAMEGKGKKGRMGKA